MSGSFIAMVKDKNAPMFSLVSISLHLVIFLRKECQIGLLLDIIDNHDSMPSALDACHDLPIWVNDGFSWWVLEL